jgi:hypothetical protein
MASDISLAVGDGARRMTYAELADIRGISPASAKRLAQRHRWGRQVGNDGISRVTVPLAFLEKALVFKESDVTPDKKAVSPVTGVTEAIPPRVADDVAADVTDDVAPVTAALAEAVKTLRDQLDITNGRADRAEARINELLLALADARTAALISGCEAAALRSQLALLTDRRPWWRKWFR